ncbi:MAG: S8 family serine peptidase [Halobacteriovoraceae bacterium]|jgi:thermitase|nr:S8 family serine peptidase [Halobacteriovoraceae bacterium]
MNKSALVFMLAVILPFYAHAKRTYKNINAIADEVIVKIKPAAVKDFKSQKSLNGFTVNSELNLLAGTFAVLKINKKISVTQALTSLNKNSMVEYAEPNYSYKAIGNKGTYDPQYSKLWGLENTGRNEPLPPPPPALGTVSNKGIKGVDINAIKAWQLSKGSKAVVIAVIDSGIDYNHPDLQSNMWVNQSEANGTEGIDDDGNGFIDDIHGYDFANNDGDPMDGNGHGTHCSGTIAAEHDNGIGIAGVMDKVSLMGIKFLTDKGAGTSAAALAAIDYATRMKVDIMSNSWGGGDYSQALKDVIVTANKAGIIFTASAGNSADNNDYVPHYPSSYDVDNVISVGAHNISDELASFSCYGKTSVHILAPGRNILSTIPNNSYAVYSGTSMATPYVTGAVGLYLALNGKTDPKTLRDDLMNSSVYGEQYGRKTLSGGRLDAYNFLAQITIPRPEKPDPSSWISLQVDPFQSAHPYIGGLPLSKTYQVPGAKYIRAKIYQFDMEQFYDYISVKDSSGNELERIDGTGSNRYTEYISGDTVVLDFNSDATVNYWGFLINEVEYILE